MLYFQQMVLKQNYMLQQYSTRDCGSHYRLDRQSHTYRVQSSLLVLPRCEGGKQTKFVNPLILNTIREWRKPFPYRIKYQWIGELTVLITNDSGEYYYDDHIIQTTKTNCFKQEEAERQARRAKFV